MERLGMLLHTAAVKVRETFSAAGTSSRSESSGTEGGRSSLGLLPHQLLSVSDLLVAATNLFALRITAGTLTDRINLQLQREAASRTSQNSELASHWQAADPGSTALPTESQDADQSVYRRAVALGDTGGLEIFVVCIWTLILLVALKGTIVAYVWSQYTGRAEANLRGSVGDDCDDINKKKRRGTFARVHNRVSELFHVSCLPLSSSYRCCPGTIAYVYVLWLATCSLLPVVLGAPLSHYAACLFFASYMASVGLISPVAAAIVEELRNLRAQREENSACCSLFQTSSKSRKSPPAEAGTRSKEGATFPREGRAAGLLQAVYSYLPGDLGKRLPLVLSPLQLGHAFAIIAFIPFISCSVSALLSCYFLPLDWQTIFIHFPYPVIFGAAIGHFVGATVSVVLAGFVLACLSSTSRSPGGCVLAAPVLQDMLLTRHQENDDSDWEDYEIEESVGVASPVPVMRGVNKAGSGVSEDGRDPGTSIRRRGKKGADGSDGL